MNRLRVLNKSKQPLSSVVCGSMGEGLSLAPSLSYTCGFRENRQALIKMSGGGGGLPVRMKAL